MGREFFEFMKTYGIVGLAIAVIIGGKLNAFITGLTEGLIMPLLAPLLGAAGADWRTSTINFGGTPDAPLIKLGTGQVLGSLLDFLIVALLVFLFAKKVLKEEAVTKK
jgi:large conductance mechanosensitive channel